MGHLFFAQVIVSKFKALLCSKGLKQFKGYSFVNPSKEFNKLD